MTIIDEHRTYTNGDGVSVVRVGVINDYEIIVRGVAAMLTPFRRPRRSGRGRRRR